jgi:ABC-2 type transport system permease protein
MLGRLTLILSVAAWEFRRFYKLRDQLLSLGLAVLGGVVGLGVQHFVGKAAGPVRVGVIGGDQLPPLQLPPTSKIELSLYPSRVEATLREAVGNQELDGLLIIAGADHAELFVIKEPIWALDLQKALSEARSRSKLQALAPNAAQLDDALASMPLEIAYHAAARGATSSAEKIVAAAMIALMCLGVFLGMASFFAGITGEKAMRVTEQVVAAISPQTWVDGKLLGLTAAAFGTLLTYGAALGLLVVLLQLGGMEFVIPWSAMRLNNLAIYLLLAILGLFFWNCAFASIAVTINDPNSSTRSSLMFLPLMFVAMGFPGLQTPDARIMKALSVLPGTSPTVMTARLVLSDVAGWEVGMAIGLMVLSILFLRRVAGKIFSANILLTGKELSWRELWRGLKHA